MYVREPIDRLVASYRIYRAVTRNEDKSFTGLVNQLLREHVTNKTINSHYQHFQRICRPCSIHYDFVGKFEKLPGEANTLLSNRKLDHLVSYRSPWDKKTNLPKSANLSSRNEYILSTLYSLDYELFGYERRLINNMHNMES